MLMAINIIYANDNTKMSCMLMAIISNMLTIILNMLIAILIIC